MAAKKASPLERLERKVEANGRATRALNSRLDLQNLNGSIGALHALAEASPNLLLLAKATPALLELAASAPNLIADVNQQKDRAIFWRVFRGWVHPLRPVGAMIWFVSLAALTASIWNVVDRIIAVLHGQP